MWDGRDDELREGTFNLKQWRKDRAMVKCTENCRNVQDGYLMLKKSVLGLYMDTRTRCLLENEVCLKTLYFRKCCFETSYYKLHVTYFFITIFFRSPSLSFALSTS